MQRRQVSQALFCPALDLPQKQDSADLLSPTQLNGLTLPNCQFSRPDCAKACENDCPSGPCNNRGGGA